MVVEIIQAAQNFAAYGLIWPLFYTAVFYLICVGALTLILGYFEKKLDYYKA
jgi:polar amino acid transport system permease protein